MKAHIRIENDALLGNNTRVFFVDRDGNETDISAACRGVDCNIRVGEINTATLDMFAMVGTAQFDLTEVAVSHLKPRRWSLLRAIRDVTAFGNDGRLYIR